MDRMLMPPGGMPPQPMMPGPAPMMGPPPMPGMGMPPMGPPPGLMGPMPGMPPMLPPMAPQPPMGGGLAELVALLSLLPTEQEDPTPEREPWQEPPEPDEAMMTAKIQADRTDYAALLDRFQRHIAFLDMENPNVGVNPYFDEDVEHYWASSMLRDEEELTVSTLGAADITYLAEARTSADRDEAEMKESFLYYLRKEAIRQFSKQGFGSRQMAEIKNIWRYGRLVSRNTLNLSGKGQKCPYRMDLLDPATVFPTWDGLGENGIETVTRAYQSTVRQALAEHCLGKDRKKAEDKLFKNKPKGKSQSSERMTMDSEVEVQEYWDRKWYAVRAGGIYIKGPVAHNLGEVPFIYTFMELGDASNTQSPTRSRFTNGASLRNSRKDMLARTGQSAIAGRIIGHTQRESILGILFTNFMEARNPATVEVSPIGTDGEPATELSAAEGARNKLPPGANVIPFPKAEVPQATGALMQAASEDLSRSSKSPASYGLTPAQTSGYALEGMNESSKHKDEPIIDCLQRHLSEQAEQLLRFYADWGHLLGEDGNRGHLRVPYQHPGPDSEPTFDLTPDIIERTGTCVECEVSILRLQTLSQVMNAINLAKQNGLITREEGIRMAKLPGYRNPQRTMKEIEIEKIKEAPEYLLAQMLKYAVEVDNDPLLAEVIIKQLGMAKMQGGGQGGPPPGAPPGGGGPAQVPGMSLPGMGMPPGQMGGRPPMPGGGGPPGMPGPSAVQVGPPFSG